VPKQLRRNALRNIEPSIVIDEYALVLVLLAVYLSECIFLSSGHATLFRRSIRENWRVSPPRYPVTLIYRLVVEGLLPQLGSVFVAEPAPPLISPSGVFYFPHIGETGSARYIDFADAEPFVSKDCSVWSGAAFVCSSGTTHQAQWLAALLTEIKASDVTRRDALITSSFHRMLDVRRAARRWRAFQRVSGFLSLGSWMSFGVLGALFAMLVVFRFQLVAAWPLGILALIVIPQTAYVFYRVHLMFFRQKSQERWKQIALMFLTPPACMRAGDFIARELFAGFHPLAVSRVVLDEFESRSFTARTLREMMYPLDIDDQGTSSEAAEWARRKWMTIVREWAEREFGDPRQLIGVPRKATPNCICYCPRCLTQYVFSRSCCSDCPDVPVEPFLVE
jgi:hypothetical protein